MKWFKNLFVFLFVIRLFIPVEGVSYGKNWQTFYATKIIHHTYSSVIRALVNGDWVTINGTYIITEYDKQ